ncbi:excalibur calcium-binding domain-containing protein [Streptomyces sp. HNM0574]|uniref:excalibur calcium-binding domain-containing protein n=1 Tax=Streptomyces sp. HNM0574 TaxID=2714954 RepID=UPI00321668B3
MSRLLRALLYVLLTAGLVAGVGSCTGDPDPPAPTRTVTQTEPSPDGTESEAPPPSPESPEETEAPEEPPEEDSAAAGTVRAYFAALNDQDYRRAWELGGKNLSGSYEEYVDGFDTTEHTEVVVLGTEGDTVSVQLAALQSDGSVKEFSGTYTVRDGEIASADIQEGPGAEPPEDSGTSPMYKNCAEVREAGKDPLLPGDPGYSDELDADNDGKACEPPPPGEGETTPGS